MKGTFRKFGYYLLVDTVVDDIPIVLVYKSVRATPIGFIVPNCCPNRCVKCEQRCIIQYLSDVKFSVVLNGNHWIRIASLELLPAEIVKKIENLRIKELPSNVVELVEVVR